MIIPIRDLFKMMDMQRGIDAKMIKNNEVKLTLEEVTRARQIAFITELGEFANETRVFKYWSKKQPSEKSVTLEEYVDGTHFTLSLAILKGYGNNLQPIVEFDFERREYTKDEIIKQMLDVVYYATTGDAISMLTEHIKLGLMYGYSWEEIVEAYYAKNKKNHDRQDSGEY